MTYHELPAWLQKIAYERCEAEEGQNADDIIGFHNGEISWMFEWDKTHEGGNFWYQVSNGILPTLAEYEARFGAVNDKTTNT